MPLQIQSRLVHPADARTGGPRLRIGLVNNMGAAAFEATERQFASLLARASGSIEVELSLYALPGVVAAEHPLGYRSTATLTGAELDALIVTGREPIANDLRDEPYWADFAWLVDWARERTVSSIWSCLAAHAAVLHTSGLARHRRQAKLCGVFPCIRLSVHPLTAGLAQAFPVPHSRWNGLPEAGLLDAGHTILSCTGEGEVDAFCKQDRSLLVFLQGHPEYETDTLLREYRRDVGRYLRGQSAHYPDLPRAYFDGATEEALADVREKALTSKNVAILEQVAAVLAAAAIGNTWCAASTRLYTNWLRYVGAQKIARRQASPSLAFSR